MIKLHVLASGSKGNATVVENAATGESVLIDCGICKRDLMGGLNEVGVSAESIRAVLITHEHTDHTKGLGVALRGLAKMGVYPTVWTSHAVRGASVQIEEALATESIGFQAFRAGDALSLAGMQVHVFPTSHDAAESFGFRFESSGGDASGAASTDVLSYVTDTGYVTPETHEALMFARIIALESNHDVRMLERGPYPYVLKQRILSEFGHLSNEQAAAELASLLETIGAGALEHVVAMHISQENNTYRLPRETLQEVLSQAGHDAQVSVGYQARITSVS